MNGEYACGRQYALGLLHELGVDAPLPSPRGDPVHPAVRWAQSGAMALTGEADGPPLMCPIPLAAVADGIVTALETLHPPLAAAALDGAALLGERAALAGLRRRGACSAGGACRLLQVLDGWLAVNLPRAEDWELLPAWLQCSAPADWAELGAMLRHRTVADCLERARLLGLAVAASPTGMDDVPTDSAPAWLEAVPFAAPGNGVNRWRAPARPPRVIDLSSLWAGPLCSQLLQLLGAEVIKIESRTRPDGARRGPRGFFDLLNGGKASVALDFGAPRDRAALRQLLQSADIVIEGSRPRALRQLGIVAEELLAGNPALTWVSINGYGRGAPHGDWVAFGDDAAVAAGLTTVMRQCTGSMLFCGDAIADPLTGLHAALAAWCSYGSGGGRLLSLPLCAVTAHVLRSGGALAPQALRERSARWRELAGPAGAAAPRARRGSGSAAPLGADNARVLAAGALRGRN